MNDQPVEIQLVEINILTFVRTAYCLVLIHFSSPSVYFFQLKLVFIGVNTTHVTRWYY